MKRRYGKTMCSLMMALILLIGMLPMSVLAVDTCKKGQHVFVDDECSVCDFTCKHSVTSSGVCTECKVQFQATVDGAKFYTYLTDALTAATEGETVTLLTDITADADIILSGKTVTLDLNSKTLDMGENVLTNTVEEDTEAKLVTVVNGTVTGANQNYVIKNEGDMYLKAVTVTNTNEESGRAVYSTGENELTVNGGSYTAKEQGIALNQTTLLFDGSAVVAGERASFLLQAEAAICLTGDVTGGADEETAYSVSAPELGVIVYTENGTSAEQVTLAAEWFAAADENCVVELVADEENQQLVLRKDISGSIAVEKQQAVYNNAVQVPAVTVKADDQELEAGVDYTVTYSQSGQPVEDPVDAGTYTVTVTGQGNYYGTKSVDFTIGAAVPEVTWSAESESLSYTGEQAKPAAKATVSLLEGDSFSGEITYSYRLANAKADFIAGLPTAAGTYEVKASVAAAGNYSAAETERYLNLTIEKRTVSSPAVELTVPEGGFAYTGTEIKPAVVVKDGDQEIPADQYTVTYTNNINAGTATVAVTANENSSVTFTPVEKTFVIAKAKQTVLTITGKPSAVKYGDGSITLGVSGGSTNAAITWALTYGETVADISAAGVVTVKAAGKATVQATMPGNDNYEDAVAVWEFEVQPAVLTISSVKADNKTYDGKNTVNISSVELTGVIGADDVAVAGSGLTGEVKSADAGVYSEVTLPALTLSGAAASNYQLTQPTGAVSAGVVISKAKLSSAPADIKTSALFNATSLTVENLGAGMPADAGALTYTAKTQGTVTGSKVIVTNWSVDQNGKLTADIAIGAKGDTITFDVTIGSTNYTDTTVHVEVALGAVAVDTAAATVTLDKTELVYNGKEQKPGVTVKLGDTTYTAGTDYTVTYPKDTTSAGEKEVTVEFTGGYTGKLTAKYTITKAKLTVSGTKAADKTYDGGTTANVTAGTLSGVFSGDEVKLTATGVFSDKNTGTGKTVTVNYALSGNDADNYELETTTAKVTASITAKTSSQLSNQISGMTSSNVDSNDLGTLKSFISEVNSRLEDTSLSSSERSKMQNLVYTAQELVEQVEGAQTAVATAGVKAVAEVTAENVTMENKSALSKAESELTTALSTYSGNYTTAEKQGLQNDLIRITAALAVLDGVEDAEALINALPDTIETVDANLIASVNEAQEAYEALSDYGKTLVNEDAVLKLDAAVETIADAANDTAVKETLADTDKNDEKTAGGYRFVWVALVIASLVAAGAVAFVIYKRRQEEADEDEYSW